MAELAREGAAGFSDDGFPVADAHRMRQALQYQRLAGVVLALHEEDPALSGARGDARGRGLDDCSGWRASRRSPRARRSSATPQLARYEGGRIHILHLSAAESVEAVERARAAGRRRSRPRSPRTT